MQKNISKQKGLSRENSRELALSLPTGQAGSSKGFTLIELLIVVAIIGLLASMILVGLSSFRTKGRDARRVADLRQIQNGLEIYYTKNLSYPTASGDALSSWTALSVALAGVGIKQTPQDPLGTGSSYAYSADTGGQNYVLMTAMEDGDNNILATDIDGTVYGIDCTDPAYCVEF